MRSIEWTVPARRDLDDIRNWLGREASPEIALRMLMAIRSRAEFLKDHPEGGPIFAGTKFRTLTVLHTPYLLVYRIVTGGVQILRVRHGRENWRGA